MLQALMKAVQTDQWTHPEVQEYRNVKDELLVYHGTVLRGNRIVVPKALRDRAVDLALGTKESRKQNVSSEKKVWFHGVDKVVKEKVNNCLPCQVATTSKAERLEPPRITPLPNAHKKHSRWIF